jgi:hypothetical protein
MQLQGIEFYNNLTAPTEKQETLYRFQYQLERGWVLESVGGLTLPIMQHQHRHINPLHQSASSALTK